MSWKRSALIPAFMAAASLGLAGCGSAGDPGAPAAGPGAPAAPAGPLHVGVTDGRLGGALTDTSDGGARELSRGGAVDPAAGRRAPNTREGVAAGDACANAELLPVAGNLATIAEATLCLLNAERADRGLATLRTHDRLQRVALAHGADMVAHGYFSHSGRNGSQPSERIRSSGYLSSGGAWRIGENLAWGTGELGSPKAIMAAWMNSSGHRANILQPAYREIGFGVVAGNPSARDGGGATYVTEFGVVSRSAQTASSRSRAGERRAESHRSRGRDRRARARRARARVALAPRSRRGRVVGRVASVRGGLGLR